MAEKRVTATTMNILYNTPSSGINIYTTYDINTLIGEVEGNIISSSSITEDKLSLTFNENTSKQEREDILLIKNGNKTVGLLTIKQGIEPEEKYFYWIDKMGKSATTVSWFLGPEGGSISMNYETNIKNFDFLYVQMIGVTVDTGTTGIVTVTVDENPDTVRRVIIIEAVMNDSGETIILGTFTITQDKPIEEIS